MFPVFFHRMLPSSSSLFMSFILLFSVVGLSTCMTRGNETDRVSLLAFKSVIRIDPLDALRSWNDTLHFCEWRGITCGRRHHRVTVVDLQSFKLAGSIAPHIGNLSFLRVLNLIDNKFTGVVPPEIGHLKRLQELSLSNNSLTGEIPPDLSNCSDLSTISLSRNGLEGEIPNELGSLTKLQLLYVYTNQLTGRIPASIGNISSLIEFSATYNSLYGSIPSSLGRLKNIQSLSLCVNSLSGTIPPSIFNLSTLINLECCGNNKLRGNLPPDLFTTLSNLQSISLSDNEFSGPIPSSISNASNLIYFQASENRFSGSVPPLAKLHGLQGLIIWGNHLGTGGSDDLNFVSSLVNATGLQEFDVSFNNFGGGLSEAISNFSVNLAYLSMGYNQISGEIPSTIGNLVNLELFSLQLNQISGIIPGSIGKLQNLNRLAVDRNQLTGQIPSSIGNLSQLTLLSLSANFLLGKVPASLGKLQGLDTLYLGQNNLSGPMPIEIFSLSSLSIAFDLSGNNLDGVLPNEVGNLRNLGFLDVSDNDISGNIPGTLGTCVKLEQLYMGGNKLQGGIPHALSSLRGLDELDLSRNNLSGELPKFLENLNLLHLLNLSYNHFQGTVPINGVFRNASAIFVMGNDKLCGGLEELHLPKCSLNESKRRSHKNLTLKLVISIVSALVGVSLLALFVFLCRYKKKERGPSSSSSTAQSLLSLSYHNLLKATDGFSEAKLIGVGAFGSVYKGIIGEGEDQKTIAVKVLNTVKKGAIRSFLAECEALRSIRHRNLVKVLTVCSGIDGSGNDFKALVYEFMANGSLENWLHHIHLEENRENETRRNLSLLQRLNIAIDTAWSLDYLHHQCERPVVHCDLKPSNILLDEEMVAHVGDFGLTRFIPRPMDELRANHSSSMGVRGSTGYVAPEYGLGSEVSTWGDVYSYGIVLLEMFTGRRPTDEMFSENWTLHEYVKNSLSGAVEEIVDPSLLDEGQAAELRVRPNPRASGSSRNGRVIECLISVLRVGVACSSEQPNDRMDISDAVAQLNSIRNKLIARRHRS